MARLYGGKKTRVGSGMVTERGTGFQQEAKSREVGGTRIRSQPQAKRSKNTETMRGGGERKRKSFRLIGVERGKKRGVIENERLKPGSDMGTQGAAARRGRGVDLDWVKKGVLVKKDMSKVR